MKFPDLSGTSNMSSEKSHISNNRLYTHEPSLSSWTYNIESMIPQHHWKLANPDDTLDYANDSGLKPSSTKKYDGASFGHSGKISYSTLFNSGDYLKSDYVDAETYSYITYTVWVKNTNLNNGTISRNNYIYRRDSAYFMLGWYNDSGIYRCKVDINLNGTGVIFNVDYREFVNWIMLTVTIDTSTNEFKCYINGKHLDTAISSQSVKNFTTSHHHYIGNSNGSFTSNYFNGYIEDLRIYDRILNEQEIALLYNQGQGSYQQSIPRAYPTTKAPIQHVKLNQSNVSNYYIHDSGTQPRNWLYNNNGGFVVSDMNHYKCYSDHIASGYAPIKLDTYPIITNGLSTVTLFYKSLSNTTDSYIFKSSTSAINFKFTSTNLQVTYGTGVQNYTKPTANEWHFLVFTVDNTYLKTYIDNVYIGTTTVSGIQSYPLSTYFLSDSFNGKIQDIRIYDYILSASEMTNIYNNGYGTLL